MVDFDYVIVGAGAAGCVLAPRLLQGNLSGPQMTSGCHRY
jgi:flavin-dependent dehydrogenase